VHNVGVAAAGVMETNFFGVLGLTRALLPAFRSQGHGRIIIVSG
jgi:NAD(P)-dependent dehydrogenase (short-subunit alcohol dehydrogenase family)